MSFKVLIIDKMHESIEEMLSGINVAYDYLPEITREEVLKHVHKYQGIVVRSKTVIDEEVIDAAKGSLQFVARAGAGVDNVALDYLEEHQIALLNAPEGNRDALAEHAMGMLLSLMNHIHTSDLEVRNFKWRREENRGYELGGKTVGLLGYGYMGQAFARRLHAFGCEIIAHDSQKTGFSNQAVTEVSLAELKERSEILSIHIPLDAHNKGLVNKAFLASFDKLDYVVNTSRGEVLVLKGLIDLLKNGTLRGAALDVLENEKLNQLTIEEETVFKELISLKNVLLTPHVAGWTHESYRKINEVLIDKIKKFIEKIH